MHPHLRKSIFTKGAAIGFSGNILLGNFWLAFNIAGGESPAWLSKAMFYSFVLVAISGIGMAVVYARIILGHTETELEPPEPKDERHD